MHIFLHDQPAAEGFTPTQEGRGCPSLYLAPRFQSNCTSRSCSVPSWNWIFDTQEDPPPPNKKERKFPGNTHYFCGAHFYYNYGKLPRSKISGSWEEEPDLWGTNKNQKSCSKAAKTEEADLLKAGLNLALIKPDVLLLKGRWRTNMESLSIAEFEVPCSARAGGTYLSRALSPLAAQFKWGVNAASMPPIKAAHIWLCLEWITGKRRGLPKKPRLRSLCRSWKLQPQPGCSVSAKSLWSEFFEVGQKRLWTGESDEEGGWGPAGGFDSRTVESKSSLDSAVKSAFF